MRLEEGYYYFETEEGLIAQLIDKDPPTGGFIGIKLLNFPDRGLHGWIVKVRIKKKVFLVLQHRARMVNYKKPLPLPVFLLDTAKPMVVQFLPPELSKKEVYLLSNIES
ncbi:hypothetical protein CR956_00055 [Candidatus Saccharibacteria bacterium]|nr:MAG: hypothetical protein CR956_00055 [Candidatus Saccharibacteria bacterium]